ncbi:hypothetical protein, partial [Paenibacillus donghaensis]|uniref:hypothetical protein n=1 Tax=Paenibacillus donghaensis TaxID=414771 RepID=UPI001D16D17F
NMKRQELKGARKSLNFIQNWVFPSKKNSPNVKVWHMLSITSQKENSQWITYRIYRPFVNA